MEREYSKQYKWWFESHSNAPAPSHWLQTTLAELDEKTQVMLRMIDEDADTFGERAEMYYERRPLLVSMVEEFYRAQRSLAEQLDHLHSRRQPDKLAYDSDESTRSEVDDFLAFERGEMGEENSFNEVKCEEKMAEIARLKEESLIKDKAIEELRRKLSQESNEAAKYKDEAESLRKENMETYELCQEDGRERQIMRRRMNEEREWMNAQNEILNMKVGEMKKTVEMKDEEKREVIRQLSMAIYMLMDENTHLKKRLSSKFQMLRGVGKPFNHL